MTDDDKRNLKVQQKEENLKYYEDMQQWLNGLTVEDRQAYEESKMHNKGMFQINYSLYIIGYTIKFWFNSFESPKQVSKCHQR